MKTCSGCQIEKPVSEFSPHRGSRDGLQSRCRKCAAAASAAYKKANPEKMAAYYAAYRAANKEKLNVKRAEYCTNNPEKVAAQRAKYRAASKEKLAAERAAWYEANREHAKAYSRAYYRANREYYLEYQRAWHKANPERSAAYVRNYQARKKNAPGTHTAEDVQAQYKRQKGRCYYCSVKVGDEYHVDHVLPLAKGGSNGPENLVVACPSCNASKNDSHPMEWAGILL